MLRLTPAVLVPLCPKENQYHPSVTVRNLHKNLTQRSPRCSPSETPPTGVRQNLGTATAKRTRNMLTERGKKCLLPRAHFVPM